MKIGLVTKSLDPRRGGAEAWTYQHAINLLERGYEVHIVARDIPAETANLPVVIHRLQRIRTPLGLANAAEAQLRGLKLDLIHDMGLGWYCDVFQPHGGCWTAITRQKLLLVPPWLRPIKRRVDPWLPRYRQLSMLACRQAAAENQILLALSQKVADEFQEFLHVPANRIRVVYNGVDVERFSPLRVRNSASRCGNPWASTNTPCWRLPWPIIFNSRACRLCSGPWKSWPPNACLCTRWWWAASGSAPGGCGLKPAACR